MSLYLGLVIFISITFIVGSAGMVYYMTVFIRERNRSMAVTCLVLAICLYAVAIFMINIHKELNI